MSPCVKGSTVFLSMLFATCAFGADLPRFSDHAESTIAISVGDREQMARLWVGMTEVVQANGVRVAAEAKAIYMPGSKLFWWCVGRSLPTATAAPTLLWFKKNFRCVAEPGAMTCFAADHRFVGARRLSEKVEGPDFPTLVGKRIAQLGTDAADGASIDSFQRILLDPVEGIAPLYARSIEEIGGPIASFDITKIVSSHGGWELTIRNSTNGRVGIVRLDTEMRPVSGTMIK